MRVRTAVSLGLLTLICSFLSLVVAEGPSTAGTTTVPRPDHVVVVVEENHSQSQVVGSPDAPYITSLSQQNANFTQSYALTHPSQPNYIALFSGSTQGVTNDACPQTFGGASLGSQVIGAGLGFTGYSEDLPSVGSTVCGSGKYARKHSPWVDFTNLPSSTNQPLTAFPSDFNDLPEVSFVIPNLDHDMHDGTVAQGDTWLQQNLGAYVTWAKTHNSLFVLTFDEDDNNNANQIATIMAGQRVVPGSYDEHIDHYSVLRTLQDAYGLAPLGGSAGASPILDVWSPAGGAVGPSADFSATCPDTTCSFDASASDDPDGSITGYSWSFGDGQSGTGVSPSHSYGSGGAKQVRLTVTDDHGNTDTVTKTVTPPGPAAFASDSFGRTRASGWGSADVGGAWTLSGSASSYSVSPGAGLMKPPVGSTLSGFLGSTSSTDTDLTTTFSSDKATTGNGIYLSATGRRVSAGNEYRAKLRLTASNTVVLSLVRIVGKTETAISPSTTVPGLTLAPGKKVSVRLQVTGTSPTTLKARVWAAGTTEPTGWTQSAVDSTAVLQSAGSVGLNTNLSSTSTNTPVVSFSSFSAQPTVAGGPVNQPPTAAFSSPCSGLACTFDGSGSSDDGSIASYAWRFGDGATASGVTAPHSYAVAGTYTATLTVTDNQGATDSVSHPVTVTSTAGQPLARDTFARTVSNGWGTADVGGAWGRTGTAGSFSVGSGSGAMTLAAGQKVTATLGGVSSTGTDLTFQVSADKVTAGYYVTVTGRRTAAGGEYRAKIKISQSGAVALSLTRFAGGTETTIKSATALSGLTYTAGMPLRVRLQVYGTSPTTVRAKVWAASGSEPSAWQQSVTDSTAGLQEAGSIALTTYLTDSATNGPITGRVSDLTAAAAP